MKVELVAEKHWYNNEETGEAGVNIEYYIYNPELRLKIYLKPADKTAEATLAFLVYDNQIRSILK